jgi:predicted carbohydrate-binding protein with CBM5 and CBM33 domain
MFEDNKANVQTFSPGQKIQMTIKIGAPHTGTANVSIVDTKANAVIGDQLIYFSDYASNSHPIPANNTNFEITMPTDLGGKCTQAGDCVIQWFWNAPEAKQTYESCVDFTMSGSGTASSAAPSIPARSVAPASTAAATAATPADTACPGLTARDIEMFERSPELLKRLFNENAHHARDFST